MPIGVAAYKVICRGTMPLSEVWANVWHVVGDEPTPATGDATEANLIQQLFAIFYEDIEGLMHTSWSLNTIDVNPMPGTSGDPLSFDVVNVIGTNVTDPLPNQDAIVLSLRTALNTRSGRGRIYLGGFAEGVTISGSSRMTSANRDVIGQAATDLSNSLQGLGAPNGPFNLAVYSPTLDDANALTGFKVGTIFDTQTRRRNRLNEAYASYPV